MFKVNILKTLELLHGRPSSVSIVDFEQVNVYWVKF